MDEWVACARFHGTRNYRDDRHDFVNSEERDDGAEGSLPSIVPYVPKVPGLLLEKKPTHGRGLSICALPRRDA